MRLKSRPKSSPRYRRTRWRLTWIITAANGCGAALTMFYFYNIDLGPTATPPEGFDPTLPFSILVTAVLLVLGNLLSWRREAPMWAWYRQATQPGEWRPPSSHVQRLALNLPLSSALLTASLWLLAGLAIAPYPAFDLERMLWPLLGISGIAGPTTSTLVYFAIERAWRNELPLFFPHGHVTSVPAFRLTVRRRMLVLFVLNMVPLLLLATISYNQATQIARSPEPAALLPNLLRLVLFLVGVGLIEAIILSQMVGAALVDPLETLGQHMDRVQHGDLEQRMEITSNDELGRLAEGFNAMIEGLAREEVVRRLFGRYVTRQVANYAIEHGAKLGGQMVEATVLFSDIRGFTSLAERVDPAALIAMLNRYFQALSTVIVKHGGMVNKFGGDSLLAIFGTPLNPVDDHPLQATRAAQAMLVALERFNADQAGRHEPTVRFGIGIATGPVLAGNVGSQDRLEYTVIGDAVNLASRLEEMTKETGHTILLNHVTAEAVQGSAPVMAIGQASVRGKHDVVDLYTLKENGREVDVEP